MDLANIKNIWKLISRMLSRKTKLHRESGGNREVRDMKRKKNMEGGRGQD